VIVGIDGPPAEQAVLRVAAVMGERLGAPVRPVHVTTGGGLRGEARASALARVGRGESQDLVGRPETLLAALVEAPGAVLSVFGARQRPWPTRGRRASGTALSVARRVERPLLLVPAGATEWKGPTHVLTVLDGTGETALAAASALGEIRAADVMATALHLGNGSGGWRPPDERHDASRVAVGRRVLEALEAERDVDLVVMVWSRRTGGTDGRAVLDVLARTPVPVLLVPRPGEPLER
jgi:hypothetical protein